MSSTEVAVTSGEAVVTQEVSDTDPKAVPHAELVRKYPVVPDGTAVGEFIMALLPDGTPLASQAMAPEECTTLKCDAGLCPDGTTVECPKNGCQTVPNHVTGIFKCSPFLPGPPTACFDDCASYYSQF